MLEVLGWFIVSLLALITGGTGYQWTRTDHRIDVHGEQIAATATALAVLAAVFERHERWHESHKEN